MFLVVFKSVDGPWMGEKTHKIIFMSIEILIIFGISKHFENVDVRILESGAEMQKVFSGDFQQKFGIKSL